VLIGRLQSVEQLGYYNFPLRLLQYAAEGLSRIGLIVAPRAAELSASEQKEKIAYLAIFANRYCLVLYLPLTIFLLHYGPEMLRIWLKERGADVALHSGPLLPVLLAGTTLALAAQFCSSTVLVGMGRHKLYSRGLAGEALLSVILMILVLPTQGILGAAFVASALMICVRGLFTPWQVSRVLDISFGSYLSGIYTRALLAAAPVWLLGWWLRHSVIDGHSLKELIMAAGSIGIVYYGLAFFFCLEAEHRDKLIGIGRRFLGAARGRA
jgi:O-antigen/teichoic acid export membrane protein